MRNAKVLTVAALIAFAAVVAQAALQNPPLKLGSPIKGTADTVTLGNGIPPRFMWGWGAGLSGYCGEFSFQSFGLYFGNYISADRVRNAAGSELLIAVNDVKAATALKYTYEEWNYNKQSNPQGSNFLDWAATHIDNGHGVAAGFYEVVKSGGDDDYDHIMPIVGYKRDSTAAGVVAANGGKALLPRAPMGRTDVLGVYYNDLYRNSTLYGAKDSTFIKTRSGCRSSSAPSKAPYTFCLPQQVDYGIALTGVVDTKGELYATTLSVNSWTEPDYSSEDNLHEAIVELTGSLVISGLTPGNKYSVLRFDSLSEVPSSGFATGPYTKKVDFTATSYTQSLPNFDTFRSDSAIFYRTVNGF